MFGKIAYKVKRIFFFCYERCISNFVFIIFFLEKNSLSSFFFFKLWHYIYFLHILIRIFEMKKKNLGQFIHWIAMKNSWNVLEIVWEWLQNWHKSLATPKKFKNSMVKNISAIKSYCSKIWAKSWDNLFKPYANNKGTDQHLCCSLPG